MTVAVLSLATGHGERDGSKKSRVAVGGGKAAGGGINVSIKADQGRQPGAVGLPGVSNRPV